MDLRLPVRIHIVHIVAVAAAFSRCASRSRNLTSTVCLKRPVRGNSYTCESTTSTARPVDSCSFWRGESAGWEPTPGPVRSRDRAAGEARCHTLRLAGIRVCDPGVGGMAIGDYATRAPSQRSLRWAGCSSCRAKFGVGSRRLQVWSE